MRERMLWIGLGVLSLLLAAALGLATSRLTEAPVGLSAEPVSAGETLAPTATPTPDLPPERTPTPPPDPSPERTVSPTPDPTATPDDDEAEDDDDDSSGRGRGRGRGRSDDDD